MNSDPGRNWRSWILAIAILAAGETAFSATALAQSQNWDWCTGLDSPTFEQRVAACTAIVESDNETPGNRAKALGNRGVAYDNSGNYENATRDYQESIRQDSTS